MNKILRYSFVALLAMVFGNVMADEATLKYSGSTTGSMLADGSNEAATVGLSDSEWSVIASKGAASNAPGLNKAGDIRLYWHADGGNTITVSSLTNTLINNIAITFTGESYSNVSVMVGENEASSVDGKYSINSTSFTLGNANTSNSQVRISEIVITYGGAASTKTATSIKFEDGYKTQIGQGPDDMFPEIGKTVALPTATVMAGETTVGNTVEWSLQVTSWKGKDGKPEPSISDGKINVADGYGVLEVTASYAGNDTYEASSKKYTLTVYNSYGLLKEMANDIADPDCTKDDEDDVDGKPVFYFFRNIDGAGFPVATSTVTYANGKYIYLTDGEGANLLFYGTNSQNLKQGDVISGNVSETNLGGFWGTLKRYNKLPEFVFTDMNVKVESEGAAVAPTTITVDQLKDYINAYVKVENAEFVSADGKNLTFKVGETELALYNQFNLEVSDLEATAKYNIVGMGCIYKKGNADAVYQLYPISFTEAAAQPETQGQSWDFTQWSAETVANLIADAAASKTSGWSDVEKKTDAEAGADPTEASKDNCFWCVAEPNADGELAANGVVIAELKGLKFYNVYTTARSLAIAVNYPSTSLGEYAGGSYLWLGGGKKKVPCFAIPSVAAGSTITMEVESHKPAEGRGVELYAGLSEDGKTVDDATKIGDTFNPTAKEAHSWTIQTAGDVIVYNTNGCHIYTIKVEAGDPSGISTVKAQKLQSNAIYNLAGQKVGNDYKGIVIVNGKKMLQK